MNLKQSITFLLNDGEITAREAPGRLVLDFLRDSVHLTGTKEGCKEGDCGACTVIIGELEGGRVNYQPMTSCLIPIGEMHGKHLVTVEGLSEGKLSPVQAALVESGGSQCGYCTPGFVVAMTNWLMDPTRTLDKPGFRDAISGNLCRCTGYRSIKAAGDRVTEQLEGELRGENRIDDLCRAEALPAYFNSIPERLRKIHSRGPNTEGAAESVRSLLIAGGTDLYVQRGEEIPDLEVGLLNNRPTPGPAREEGENIVVDARMSFQAFGDDPLIRTCIPDILAYNDLIASWPLRIRATLGGNLCNASPIADMTCLLLALQAELHLEGGDAPRSIPLKDFYLGYKELAKFPEEIISVIHFPKPGPKTHINWEKVSKRPVLDIASVNSAASFVVDNGTIEEAHLALGGVAPIPLYLSESARFLVGKSMSADLIFEMVDLAQSEIKPIDDVRGSADYKRMLSRQLLLAHFIKLFPEVIREEEVYAAF